MTRQAVIINSMPMGCTVGMHVGDDMTFRMAAGMAVRMAVVVMGLFRRGACRSGDERSLQHKRHDGRQHNDDGRTSK
jgi:hypothetical protein